MVPLAYMYYKLITNYSGLELLKFFYLTNKFWLKLKMSKVYGFKSESFLGHELRFQTYTQFFVAYYDIFVEKQHECVIRKKRPVFVDGGANYGMSTIYFKYKYPRSKVYVFEPDPDNFRDLKYNLRKLRDLVILDMAIAHEKSVLTFFRDDEDTLTGGSLVAVKPNSKKIRVKANTLGSFVDEDIDYLKLDIEGSESAVIKEISKGFKHEIHNIFLEYHFNPKNPDNKLSDILDFIESNNYRYLIESKFRSPFRKINSAFGLNIFIYKL